MVSHSGRAAADPPIRAYRLLSLHPGPDLGGRLAAAMLGTSAGDAATATRDAAGEKNVAWHLHHAAAAERLLLHHKPSGRRLATPSRRPSSPAAVVTVIRPRVSFRAASAAGIAVAAWDFIGVSVTHAALLSPYAVGVGIGDVALHGILIVIAGRAGRLAGTSRLYPAAVTGYGAGLAACLTVAAMTGVPLPAMMFLVPGVILMVAATAWRAGAWPALASKDPLSPAAAHDTPQPRG
jgi:hypothetical protein